MIGHSDYINFSEVILYCDGSNAVIFELRACQIPLSVLEAAPFYLVPGNEIVAKYQAHNPNGYGPLSDETYSGALIQSVPNQMAIPTRDPATTTTSLVVNWVGLVVPDNGYATVLSYNLQWDANSEGATFYDLVGFETESLVKSF